MKKSKTVPTGAGTAALNFSDWLAAMPRIEGDGVRLNVPVELDAYVWFGLTRAAQKRRMTVPELFDEFLTDYCGGLLEWANNAWQPCKALAEERANAQARLLDARIDIGEELKHGAWLAARSRGMTVEAWAREWLTHGLDVDAKPPKS